ncbi:PLP-dependent aminotransferase family protein [Clostridium sediminicola]|uniref:MocR-like pyridoxine biosynthesis transcription factor PdxR n=1 Tax=Clostridium sediminicola TaxID=3114879 RepID=UPI0031F1F0C2
MYLQIDRNSFIPMIKQIYTQLKDMILKGDLESNHRLPSSRRLAETLQVSRNVVIEAYEMLTSEGYTKSVQGSGIYVNEAISISRPTIKGPKLKLSGMKDSNNCISFKSGLPALDKFPRSKWLQCYRESIFNIPDKELGYDLPNGYLPFRKTLSEYLFRSHGIRCHEDQIIITSGAVQALYLISKYFSQLSGSILLEEPTAKGIRNIVTSNHSNVIYHSINHKGIDASTLPKEIDLTCIITTPSHQYPLGGSLSISKRVELIRYARDNNCYVVEDDYDSEYRYGNSPVESLYELDSDHVIYIGSFSKILLPSIRIGYMVLPVNLIEPIYQIKSLIDIHCPTLNQATMDKFIAYGYLEQHIAKTKKIYKKRRLILINALIDTFGKNVTILGKETGIHLVAEFSNITFTKELMNRIMDAGVYIMPVSYHAVIPEKHDSQLIFGYGNLTEDDILKGINILYKCVKN